MLHVLMPRFQSIADKIACITDCLIEPIVRVVGVTSGQQKRLQIGLGLFKIGTRDNHDFLAVAPADELWPASHSGIHHLTEPVPGGGGLPVVRGGLIGCVHVKYHIS